MIKVLISDDNERKVRELRELLDEIPEVKGYDIGSDLTSTKGFLTKGLYDLLILDLCIPNRMGDVPSPQNGKNFIQELNRSSRLIKPAHVLGFSAYDNFIEEFHSDYQNEDIWSIIKYEESSNDWTKKIINKVEYLIQSKRDLSRVTVKSYEYDLAIITALRQPELDSILRLPANWNQFNLSNDGTVYHKGIFKKDGKSISVVAASAPQMGMVATSVLTHKIITSFRPKYIAMTGIAAGIKGKGNFGDILATDISFDSGSGKIKTGDDGGTKFEADFRSINLNVDLKATLIQAQGDRDFLDSIRNGWQGNKPDGELNIHIGPLASGAGVVENERILENIRGHQRKLIGIDMETYGVFYTVENSSKPRPYSAISFKSISDFADSDKNDNYQKYASYTSANYLYHFCLDKLDFE